MPSSTFLIGGGRDPRAVVAGYGPFVRATGGGRIVAVALDDERRWRDDLARAGAGRVDVVLGRVPAAAELAGCAGVFVAGGATPAYQELLAADAGWLPDDVPYAGFSAGAAIAARRALVGGWRVAGIPVCDEDAGEGLDAVALRDGLGRVAFTVEVHAAQWGTLGRLIAAVEDEGWALDEGTCLEVGASGEPRAVHGLGRSWQVRRTADAAVLVRAVPAGSAPG